jgi:hypothetical protein
MFEGGGFGLAGTEEDIPMWVTGLIALTLVRCGDRFAIRHERYKL